MTRRNKNSAPELAPEETADDEFRCLQCGSCCVGEGAVWLDDEDIGRIAAYLGLTRKEFVARYTRRFFGIDAIALTDKDDAAQSCVFFGKNGCVVHPVKPRQCATFPLEWTREDALDICKGLQALERRRKRGRRR